MESPEPLRHIQDHRNIDPGVVSPALALQHAGAGVGPIGHDRVLLQAVLPRLGQHIADQCIHFGNLVVRLRPVLPALLGAGMVPGIFTLAGSWTILYCHTRIRSSTYELQTVISKHIVNKHTEP